MSDDRIDSINKTALLSNANSNLVQTRAELDILRRKINTKAHELEQETAQHEETKKELANVQKMLTEWMLSNEACRRLAKSYGGQLNKSEEEQAQDKDATVIAIACENADFGATDYLRAAKIRHSGAT